MRALTLAAVLALSAGPALAGAPVTLRPSLVSRGDQVTLADLFDGAVGPAASVSVGPAAAPGMNAVLDAGRVQMAARAAGLDWSNGAGMRRLLVASLGGVQAPATQAAAARRARQVLAYARNLNAGEIVQPADLIWSDTVIAGADAPADADRLIGQAARRPLRAGAAAQRGDLTAPAVVHRDETIAIAFETQGISLVLQAKALKDAAVGESVQVMNMQSRKTIEAVASGPGRAVVGPRAEALKAAPFSTASLR